MNKVDAAEEWCVKLFWSYITSKKANLYTSKSPTAASVRRRTKVPKPKAHVTSQRRRTVSTEASKYIEHLEAELTSAQAQLSSLTSPTITRAQSTKLRAMNQETRVLQDELHEWEQKYHARVQEEIDQRYEMEVNFKARLRTLEDAAETHEERVKELEYELQERSQTLEAVETANMDLEKRIEIMSDLIAQSPTKIGLCSESPARPRIRHIRPKSMLPRFPPPGTLQKTSPEKLPQSQPTSPAKRHSLPAFITEMPETDTLRERLNMPSAQSRGSVDLESVFSDAPIAGEPTTTTMDGSAGGAFRIPDLPSADGIYQGAEFSSPRRPHRRMRRFHAGSICPKPLILPSTSFGGGAVPASAPPLEHHDTPPSFPFPVQDLTGDSSHLPPDTAGYGRQRSFTFADETTTLRRFDASPFLAVTPQLARNGSALHALSPSSDFSQATARDLSSIGSAVGRNLFEELSRVKSSGTLQTSQPSGTYTQARAERSGTDDGTLRPAMSFGYSSDLCTAQRAALNTNHNAEDTTCPHHNEHPHFPTHLSTTTTLLTLWHHTIHHARTALTTTRALLPYPLSLLPRPLLSLR
ncbi:hypothetical protein LTR66_013771, partial [Elasticomyces elasticus]